MYLQLQDIYSDCHMTLVLESSFLSLEREGEGREGEERERD